MKRRFSIEPSFIQSRTNDLIYTFMRSISTINPKPQPKEYLSLTTLKSNRKLFLNICDLTPRQFTRALNKLIDEGLVTFENDNYYFPFDYDERYKLIDKNMLKYLINTRSVHAIRIYLILLNFYSYKKGYVFTLKEIKTLLGYSENNYDFNKTIQDILISLKREKLIDYTQYWDTVVSNGKELPSARYRLLFVATEEKQLN